jgi:pSer/pThr/pTyr-binding forkhead associated (FHA) protein
MKIAKIELNNGVTFAIQDFQLPMTIGRGKTCDIRIAEPFVSRLHCELFLDKDDVLYLKDLSANGTTVDNRDITGGTVEISSRSQVTFADECVLTVTPIDDSGITVVPMPSASMVRR